MEFLRHTPLGIALTVASCALFLEITLNRRDPELIPDSALAKSWVHVRGGEKKRNLIAYVREHLGELRLHFPKLLTESLHR
ncbi:MAG: hypothetical protein ABI128_03760 [Rhodanobacter sp.]